MKIFSIIVIIILSLLAAAFIIGEYYGGALGLIFVNILIYFKVVKNNEK